MKNFIKSRTLGFWLRLAAAVFAIVPCFYMGNAGGMMKEVPADYTSGLALLVVGIVLLVASLVFDGKRWNAYIGIAAAVLLSFALALFVFGSVLSIVDHVFNIVMWGDATQFPAIVGFGVVQLLATGLSVSSCFLTFSAQ